MSLYNTEDLLDSAVCMLDASRPYAQEFEVLVARAARHGVLELGELLDTYQQLRPSGHPHLANNRKLDLEVATRSVLQVPRELFEAERILLVPKLSDYPHHPVAKLRGLPAGKLNSQTLLVEATLGTITLTSFAATLCALVHEGVKAQRLLAEGEADIDIEDEPTGSDLDITADVPLHAASDLDSTTDMRLNAAPHPPEPQEEQDLEQPDPVILGQIAFIWGTDPTTLWAHNQETDGDLLAFLLGHSQLPTIGIHPDLTPHVTSERGKRRAERTLGALAEMGLAMRPIHLWVGPGVITECVSPYGRELREVMRRWAEDHPDLLGGDLSPVEDNPRETTIYAITHDFIRHDSRLQEERIAADRSVGIMRYDIDGHAVEAIDLARIDPSVCDARLADWGVPQPAPVILRLDYDPVDSEATMLRYLLRNLGRNITGVTAILSGKVLRGPPGSVLVPEGYIPWGDGRVQPLAGRSKLDADNITSYCDSGLVHGMVLSVPGAEIISQAYFQEAQRDLRVEGVEMGGAKVWEAINDAVWRRSLSEDADLAWMVVGTQYSETGRPTVASLSGYSAVAIARLRQLTQPPKPQPRQAPIPPAPEPKRAPSPRAMRIKA